MKGTLETALQTNIPFKTILKHVETQLSTYILYKATSVAGGDDTTRRRRQCNSPQNYVPMYCIKNNNTSIAILLHTPYTILHTNPCGIESASEPEDPGSSPTRA
jgi:hypothetical protein